MMDLSLLNLGILKLAAPCCVFYATRHRIYRKLNKGDMAFAISLIWYHKHRQTHTERTRTNALTDIYKYIFTLRVMRAQQLHVLHWMNNFWIQICFYRGAHCLCFSKITHLQKSYICTESFLCNTTNNGVKFSPPPIWENFKN